MDNPRLARRPARTYVWAERNRRLAMKAFAIAVVIAAVLATGVGFAFNSLNESSAEAYSTSGVRL